eukprot:SAG31_NODE_4116_length_3567_cov_2.159746_4_plen_216_part_00
MRQIAIDKADVVSLLSSDDEPELQQDHRRPQPERDLQAPRAASAPGAGGSVSTSCMGSGGESDAVPSVPRRGPKRERAAEPDDNDTAKNTNAQLWRVHVRVHPARAHCFPIEELHIPSISASFNMGGNISGGRVNVILGLSGLNERYRLDDPKPFTRYTEPEPELVKAVQLSAEELKIYTTLANSKRALDLAATATEKLLERQLGRARREAVNLV